MKITYIDIGLHKDGFEIDMFQLAALGHDVTMYGIEAHPEYIEQLKENHPQAKILNYAINNTERLLPLYLSESSDGHGNSIFPDKNNVTTDFVKVQGVKLSTLIERKEIVLSDFNVLRYNIEGAEWHLLNDLIESELWNKFNILSGARSDMHKVTHLKDLKWQYQTLVLGSGKWVDFWYHPQQQKRNKKMIEKMKSRINERIDIPSNS